MGMALKGVDVICRLPLVEIYAGDPCIFDKMMELWIKVCREGGKPNLILAGDPAYLEAWKAKQGKRYTSIPLSDAGFTSFKFLDADVVLDSGVFNVAGRQGVPDNTLYFIKTDNPHWHLGGDETIQDAELRGTLIIHGATF